MSRRRDDDEDDDAPGPGSRPPSSLALEIWSMTLAAAARPALLRRDRLFTPGAAALDVADVLRYVAAARRTLRGPLCVELAGPGDPLASADTVLRSLALLHEHHPDVLTGLAIDGPLLDEYADELADFGVTYVRVRLDTLRVRVARRLVAGALHRGDVLERDEAARLLVDEAPRALHVARRVGLAVAVQITLFPSLNRSELGALARAAARAGVEQVEVVPHVRVEGTPLARAPVPTPGEMVEARAEVERVLAEERATTPPATTTLSWLTPERRRAVALDALDADDLRRLLPEPDADEHLARVLPPRRALIVAVTSEDGSLVDLPLTHAPAVRLYAVTERAIRALGARALPTDPRRRLDGVGDAPEFLAALVGCRALVATRIPGRAATLLKAVGILPVAAGGAVAEVLDRIARGTLRAAGG